MISMSHLDHLVLMVKNMDATVAFYTEVLGMQNVSKDGHVSLHFGMQKFNLHEKASEFSPKAKRPSIGSADICFIANDPLYDIIAHLNHCGISIEEGPVQRTGATGPIYSIYIRDPDENLIEIANKME